MKSLLDPSFEYVPSVKTDIRKTFDRVRKEMRKAEEARKKVESEVVRPLQITRRK